MTLALALCLLVFTQSRGSSFDKSEGNDSSSSGRFENTSRDAPWNDFFLQDDLFAPWNDEFKKDDPNAPWNRPFSRKEETNRYLREKNVRNSRYYWN